VIDWLGTAATIEPLPRFRRRSIGSAEGKLEAGSIHRVPRFVVYHSLTQKAIYCRFESDTYLEPLTEPN
jgi:hypothetical protein